MLYLILADLKSLWRQFSWLFYLCTLAAVLSFGYLGFTYFAGLKIESTEGVESQPDEPQEKTGTLNLAINGDCPGDWPAEWTIQSLESESDIDRRILDGDAVAGINCTRDNAELVAGTSETFTVMAQSGVLALVTEGGSRELQNVRPPKNESSDGPNTMMFWGMTVFFIFFPVKIASTFVFEEKNSGRLEWLLGNGISPRQYLAGKSVSLSLAVISTISLLLLTIMISFMAMIVFAVQSDPEIAYLFEQVLKRTEGAHTPLDMVLSVAGSILPEILGFLVSTMLLSALLVVIATGVYLTVFSQVRTVTLMEMGMLIVLFLLPLMLEDPSVLWWAPVTGTFMALEAAITIGDGPIPTMDLLVPQIAWLGGCIVIVGTFVTRRMHWSHC